LGVAGLAANGLHRESGKPSGRGADSHFAPTAAAMAGVPKRPGFLSIPAAHCEMRVTYGLIPGVMG